jgi:hypothetical protein
MYDGLHRLALVRRPTGLYSYSSGYIRLCRCGRLEILDRLLATFWAELFVCHVGPPRRWSLGTRNLPMSTYCTHTAVT